MDEDMRFDPGDLKFTFGWCELCQAVFVRCPKCGNNTCNAGKGPLPGKDGPPCDVCMLAHQYDKLFRLTECTLCDHWVKGDGGRCGKHGGLPEVRPCKDFSGIVEIDGKKLSIDEEALLNKIFGMDETEGNKPPTPE